MKDYYRRVEFKAAYDKRHEDPSKNYGVHGVEIQFSLVGENGAITWLIMTTWMLPQTMEFWDNNPLLHNPYKPGYTAGPVGFHYPPEYESEWLEVGPCHLLGECKADVGFIYGETLMKRLIEEGEEGLWDEMIEAYGTMQIQEEQT